MPKWVYASWSIGLFLYQTFDAVDGTQAYVDLVIENSSFSTNNGNLDEEPIKVGRWESYLTMVSTAAHCGEAWLINLDRR